MASSEGAKIRVVNRERIHIPRDFSKNVYKDILAIRLGLLSTSLVENFSLIQLSFVNSNKDILLDILLEIPRDTIPFSVFGSAGWKVSSERVRISWLEAGIILKG